MHIAYNAQHSSSAPPLSPQVVEEYRRRFEAERQRLVQVGAGGGEGGGRVSKCELAPFLCVLTQTPGSVKTHGEGGRHKGREGCTREGRERDTERW
jgi:hypothetical protein